MNQIDRTVTPHTLTANVNIELVPKENGYDIRIISCTLAFDGATELDGETCINVLGPAINLSGTRQIQVESIIGLPSRLFF